MCFKSNCQHEGALERFISISEVFDIECETKIALLVLYFAILASIRGRPKPAMFGTPKEKIIIHSPQQKRERTGTSFSC